MPSVHVQPVVLGRDRVSVDVIAAVAAGAEMVVGEAALHRVEEMHRASAELARTRSIYGRDTGVGANRTVLVQSPTASMDLLRSHASSAGKLREGLRVRAMLAVRLSQLAAGGSGMSPAVVAALADLLASDAVPPVREYGSIGTGDLTALATVGLALAGEVATVPAVPTVVGFAPADALAFISSNAGTLGDTALATSTLRRLARVSLVIAAFTFVALDGNLEAFSPLAEAATPFPGARRVCVVMRGVVDASRPADHPGWPPPARIQDPFALRCLPQVHGVLLDSLDQLAVVAEALMAASSENPVFGSDTVAHHGGFHVAYLATALDTGRSALAQSAQLVAGRLAALTDPTYSGLAPFLGDGHPGASGIMALEYVAASALAQLRAAATPTAVQSVSISRGVEEDANFAALGARQVLDSIAAYRVMLASELVAAVRAIGQRAITVPGPLGTALDHCLAALPADNDDDDRDLTADLLAADTLLDDPLLAHLDALTAG